MRLWELFSTNETSQSRKIMESKSPVFNSNLITESKGLTSQAKAQRMLESAATKFKRT